MKTALRRHPRLTAKAETALQDAFQLEEVYEAHTEEPQEDVVEDIEAFTMGESSEVNATKGSPSATAST